MLIATFHDTLLVTLFLKVLSEGVSFRSVRPLKWSRPANDPSTTNDPQIGPQMIPKPEMIPANGVAKNRKWRGLHE